MEIFCVNFLSNWVETKLLGCSQSCFLLGVISFLYILTIFVALWTVWSLLHCHWCSYCRHAQSLQACFWFSEQMQSKQQKRGVKETETGAFVMFSRGFCVLNFSIFISHCELALNGNSHRSVHCTIYMIGLIHGLWTYRPNFVVVSCVRVVKSSSDYLSVYGSL